jgi:hypothetical protein
LVEGRVVFGSLFSSVAAVLLVVILGLRYLNGTLGGPNTTQSLFLLILFLAVIAGVLVLSWTDWLGMGGRPPRNAPATGGIELAKTPWFDFGLSVLL